MPCAAGARCQRTASHEAVPGIFDLRDATFQPTLSGAEAPGSWVGAVSANAGAWPSPDTAADRLLAALQAAVDKAPEGSKAKTRARRLLDGFLAAGRDFAVDVASGVVTGQITT